MLNDHEILPFQPEREAAWNALVAASANGTFLIDRRFMGYHAERFEDASLLVRTRGRLVAVLPAHRVGDRVASHAGLSYGGLIQAEPLGPKAMLALLQTLQAHWRAQGVRELLYKTVPAIYHRLPCEADRWALWRCGAALARRDALAVIGPTPAHWPRPRRRAITQAARQRAGLTMSEHAGADAPWGEYWPLLAAQLHRRHASQPAHTLAEITLLAGRFPREIGLHLARLDGQVVAGLVLFDTPTVRHLQYMAADDAGRRVVALDLMLERAIAGAQAAGRWFDFGHSHEDEGRALNTGLAFYKESFGASAVAHDHYLLPC